MRRLALLLCVVFLTACVASTPEVQTKRATPRTEIIPPPDFDGVKPVAGERSCGGMVAGPSQTCSGENDYCHRDVKDMCGAADAPGVCRTKPEMCTLDYNPICGCDGKTYSNECAANANGISAASLGECP